jgi:VWFA-related protein
VFLSDLTSDQKKLSKAINQASISDKSGSDMNGAVFQIVNNHFASLRGRKAIIVLTDGMVMKQAVSTQQTMDMLQKSDTLFYPVIFKTKFYSDARLNAAAKKRKPVPIEMLEILAQETAGKFYEKDAEDLKEAFQNIAEELKNQYLLGFYPQNAETRRLAADIRIVVDRKELTVKTKKRWNFKKAS